MDFDLKVTTLLNKNPFEDFLALCKDILILTFSKRGSIKTTDMNKVFAVIGIGALGLLVMSSTCSSDTADLQTSKGAKVQTSKEVKAMAPAEDGISFENMTFEKALKEAKKSGKLVFIDAYTDWCGPCKRMAATSFKDATVGDLYNKSFINIKVEMEKDAEGPEIARLYGVKAYPTLLLVDGNGRLVKQSIGLKTSDQLIALANSVL